jgi:hypothetical protein
MEIFQFVGIFRFNGIEESLNEWSYLVDNLRNMYQETLGVSLGIFECQKS